MNTLRKFLLASAFLFMVTISSVASAQDDRTPEAKSRRWKVMVLVREQHIDRPRIPDPAVETALSKALIESGYKLVDRQRVAEIRNSDVIDKLLAGGPNAVREARKLGAKYGADLLITGEAFTQEVSRSVVNTDLGSVLRIYCRGRIEVRGIRLDTGEIFWSDSITKTGSPESTVELSSKTCLEQGGDAIAPSLLIKMNKLALSPTVHVELIVKNVPTLSVSRDIEKAIRALSGVKDVGEGDFTAHTYSTEIQLPSGSARDFAAMIESASTLKKYHLHIDSANGSKIVAGMK